MDPVYRKVFSIYNNINIIIDIKIKKEGASL